MKAPPVHRRIQISRDDALLLIHLCTSREAELTVLLTSGMQWVDLTRRYALIAQVDRLLDLRERLEEFLTLYD